MGTDPTHRHLPFLQNRRLPRLRLPPKLEAPIPFRVHLGGAAVVMQAAAAAAAVSIRPDHNRHRVLLPPPPATPFFILVCLVAKRTSSYVDRVMLQ